MSFSVNCEGFLLAGEMGWDGELMALLSKKWFDRRDVYIPSKVRAQKHR